MNADFSFPVEVDINGLREVYVNVVDFVPYIPAKLSGHPDSWYPAEGGEFNLYFSWIDNYMPSDILESSISDEDYRLIEEMVFEQARNYYE